MICQMIQFYLNLKMEHLTQFRQDEVFCNLVNSNCKKRFEICSDEKNNEEKYTGFKNYSISRFEIQLRFRNFGWHYNPFVFVIMLTRISHVLGVI